jgi:hypothetical protein
MANTFEIMFKGSLSCIAVTHDPEMKDQISHMTRKTEVTPQQHNDKPCGLARGIENRKVNGI